MTHQYSPHKKYPWFCRDCGYPENESLKHGCPAQLVAHPLEATSVVDHGSAVGDAQAPAPPGEAAEMVPDDLVGDDLDARVDKWRRSAGALLALDAAGTLVPHGIGGLAREIITRAAAIISALAAPPAPADAVEKFSEGASEIDFGSAMTRILSGRPARRKDWNRVAYVKKERRVSGMTNPVIVMVMRDGTVGPYTPSGCDMTAADWVEVTVPPWKPTQRSSAMHRGETNDDV